MPSIAIEKGKIVIYEYDPNRKDGCYYNFIQIPESILNDEILNKLKKAKEPIKL